MAGGEGSRRGCATGGVEAVTGEGGVREASSAKRKAETETETVAGHLAPPLKECATVGEDAGGATAVAVAVNAAPPENRMSIEHIRWVLNCKLIHWSRKLEELRESNPSLVPLPGEEMDDAKMKLYSQANEIRSMDERNKELQERVRHELETKGYIEMDDDWVRRKAEVNAIEEELMKKVEGMLLYLTEGSDEDDESSDGDDDDDDEF